MEAILQFDSSILLWIQNSVRGGFLTPVMKVITHLGDKGIFWILVTLALLILRKTRPLGVVCMVSMVIGLVITNLIIKNWVARIRPYEVIQGLECIVGKEHDFSFPSGHTTNSLACAWVLFRKAPRKMGVPALVLAILIALSRRAGRRGDRHLQRVRGHVAGAQVRAPVPGPDGKGVQAVVENRTESQGRRSDAPTFVLGPMYPAGDREIAPTMGMLFRCRGDFQSPA